MDGLGPFETPLRIAVAVSGGADSMAAVLLTQAWAQPCGGRVLALIVDHGIRDDAATEASEVAGRLRACGIEAFILAVTGLAPGPALAERARDARHDALEAACTAAGIVHLVFGHHAGDQAETVIMRMLRQSAAGGLAGMAALVETSRVRRLRPLLGTNPETLRAWLRGRGIGWVEDPSNASPFALRGRLRAERRRLGSVQSGQHGFAMSTASRGRTRAAREQDWHRALADRVTFYPQGFAVMLPGPIPAAALAHLLQVIGGAFRPPSLTQVVALAAAPVPATLSGTRLLAAGRFGPGLLVVREARAVQTPVAARIGAVWDERFRLANLPPGYGEAAELTLGAWGDDAPRGRHAWPSAAMRTMPVLRQGYRVVSSDKDIFNHLRPIVVHAAFSPATVAPYFPLPSMQR